jgi:2'-5' RNA ligase
VGADALGEARLERVRAFFGLPLPEAHRVAFDVFVQACAALAPAFRWTPALNLHLTVRFLGHVERGVAEEIAERLEAAGLEGFGLKLGAVGTFKRGRLARVVWLGLSEGSDEIGLVAERVEAECVNAGLEPEGRRFHAHLTLARARPRDGAALPALPDTPELPGWRADELLLYRSRLGRSGSVYEPLRRLTLR